MRLLIFGHMKSTIFNFQLSAIKLSVVGKYEVGSLFADKGIPSLHLSQFYNMNYDWGKCCHHIVFFFIIFSLFYFLYFYVFKAFKIVIKKRSGTRSGTLHYAAVLQEWTDSWKIHRTQKNK